MPLKVSYGNMYPWVTNMHTHLGGECSHKCSYCYVDNPIGGRIPRYKGKVRLIDYELKVNYGSGKIIFIEHCNDLFAKDVSDVIILQILEHINKYPDNKYIFQTKNPERYKRFLDKMPPKFMLGCTIETNRDMDKISKAPPPTERYLEMWTLSGCVEIFITCEPILDFDVDILSKWITDIHPNFVNIGADSKNHNLEEPSIEKVMTLGKLISDAGIEVKEKRNLNRLRK
jgi:DNA repair photolyase